jgi:outer membrane murein-binding lipoprotein Lpp
MDDQPAPVDLNTAGLEELRTLPGIGLAMAERLREARPFTSLEDLRRVNGISASVLERLRPRVTLSPVEPVSLEAAVAEETIQGAEPGSAPDAEAPLETAPPSVEIEASPLEMTSEEEQPSEQPSMEPAETATPETSPAAEPVSEPASAPVSQPASAPAAPPRPASRSEVLWLALGALVFSTLLGAALSLGLLVLVNGGLSYARPFQISELNRQVDGLNAQAGILQQDMDALRSRIDNLEGLSGRVGAVEKAVDGMRKDMDTAQSRMDELGRQLGNLDSAVSELQTRTNRFQGFLEGLRELVEGIFKP